MDPAVLKACLADEVHAWRLPEDEESSDAWMTIYDRYGCGAREAGVIRALGRGAAAEVARHQGRGLRVLDVGSGALRAGLNVVDGLAGLAGVGVGVDYTCIDWRVDPRPHIERLLPSVATWRWHEVDVFSDDLPRALQGSTFDLVVIDVEPHGREVEAYEAVRPFLQPVHVCVLKHVGWVDTLGRACGDIFVRRYVDEGCVYDYYFPESEFTCKWSCMRYLFLVLDRTRLDAACSWGGVS
jgi:hypothetical protein